MMNQRYLGSYICGSKDVLDSIKINESDDQMLSLRKESDRRIIPQLLNFPRFFPTWTETFQLRTFQLHTLFNITFKLHIPLSNTNFIFQLILTFPTSVIAFQLQWFSKLIENFRTSTVDTFQNHSFQFHLEPSDF